MRHPLLAVVQFLMMVVLVGIGIFLIALAFAPQVRFELAYFFTYRTDLLILTGIFVLTGAFLLGTFFFSMNRHRFFQLSMRARVEEEFLRSYLERYWKQLFPQEDLKVDIAIRARQKIEFITELPSLPESEQKVVLEKAERDLAAFLAKQLGYKREFLFTVLCK